MNEWHSIEELTPRNVFLDVGWHELEKDTIMNSGVDSWWAHWRQTRAMLTDRGWIDENGKPITTVTRWRQPI